MSVRPRRRLLLPPVFCALGLALAGNAEGQIIEAGHVEDTNVLALRYTGTWHAHLDLNHSGGSAMQSTEGGASVSLAFDGTGLRWIGYRDEWSGIASVFVDGEFVATVDTYASPARSQAVVYELQGLSPGGHVVTLQVLNTHSGSSAESWIWVDAFEILSDGGSPPPPPDPWASFTRAEQNGASVSYSGTWQPNDGSFNSGGSAVLALDDGARATFSFSGTRVRWIGYRDEWAGIARVYLDGALVAWVDSYASPAEAQAVLFRTAALAAGPHTLAVEATHLRNASSNQRWVWVDAFDVVP